MGERVRRDPEMVFQVCVPWSWWLNEIVLQASAIMSSDVIAYAFFIQGVLPSPLSIEG
jgi:hypothetical protein